MGYLAALNNSLSILFLRFGIFGRSDEERMERARLSILFLRFVAKVKELRKVFGQ